MKFTSSHRKTLQPGRRASAGPHGAALAPSANCTGLPDALKSGIEGLSGLSLDDVRVHYNSSKPAGLQALAYTQGADIHVAPGQERHLPHEAWHVVQQKQGRVGSTFQMKGVPVNDDVHLESEADAMGTKAAQLKARAGEYSGSGTQKSVFAGDSPIQMRPQIVKLERGTPEELIETDPDLAIKLLGADSVVDENADRLATRTGASVEELSPPNQRFPADWIRGVTNLYIIGHGAKGKLAGMTPRKLAGNLYPAIYEEVKKTHPEDYEARYTELSKQIKMESIDIVACHSAEDYLNPETNEISSFAKDFYGFMKNLNKEWARSLTVSGVNGYAFVDYEGDVRAIPETVIDQYRQEKKGLKSVKDKTRVLDKYALQENAIKKFMYDPETRQTLETSTGKKPRESKGFCFITTACVQARGLPDDCLELTTLRTFRDRYIATMHNGKAMIKVYYENSPMIVEAINQRPDARAIYDGLYDVICMCVRYIQEGAYESAFQMYVDMVIELRNRFMPMSTIPSFFYKKFLTGA